MRTLDEERSKIRATAKKEADDERKLKDAEKDKLIGDLKTQIDDLKRKSEWQIFFWAASVLMSLKVQSPVSRAAFFVPI